MKAYRVEVRLSKQEDGLWRAEVPALPGCFVDGETVSGVLRDIQEVAAMFIDLYQEEGRRLPDALKWDESVVEMVTLPILPEEHEFKKPTRRSLARQHRH